MNDLNSGQADEIRPGVRRLVANNPGFMTGPGTNTYVIGHDRFLVVDPGPMDDVHVQRILDCTHGRIDAVLVTHTHSDHSPAATVLSQRSSAPILGRSPTHASEEDALLAFSREIADGDRLSIDGIDVRAIHTPGHASNHVCFLIEGEGLLLTGDHIMQGSTVLIGPPDGDMKVYLRSLERLKGEPVVALAPGHGNVIADGQAEISRVIAHRLKREAKLIARLSATTSATLEELLLLVYDDVHPGIHGLARLSLLAHLRKLEEEGRVGLEGDQQFGRWRIIAARI